MIAGAHIHATSDARARLAAAVARTRCLCGRPDWIIVHTAGRTRYLKCRRCGRTGKIWLSK